MQKILSTWIRLSLIDRWQVEVFKGFLDRLDAIEDTGGGSLLDNTVILYGGGMSDGHYHTNEDLPLVLFGGSSVFEHGQAVRQDGGPLSEAAPRYLRRRRRGSALLGHDRHSPNDRVGEMKRLVLPLVLSLVGCRAETEVPQDSADTSVVLPPTAYERDLAPLLLACTGCHSGDEPESGLDLTDIWAISGQESSQTEMSLLRALQPPRELPLAQGGGNPGNRRGPWDEHAHW